MDNGQKATEKTFLKLLRGLRSIYGNAGRKILLQAMAYIKPYEKDGKRKHEQYTQGKLSESDYRYWIQCQVFRGEKWENNVKSMLITLLDSSKSALNLIRTGQLDVFSDNGNYIAREISRTAKIGISFELFDRATVERLMKDKPQLLPKKVVNAEKQTLFDERHIRNAIAQGVILGDSIPDIAKRIATDSANIDLNTATRYARTAMTSAQNAGRIENMRRAEAMGIRIQKQWLSAHDSRVRDAHIDLDGQIKDIDEPFDSMLGEIDFPGDPAADPANVWNCRCCLTYHYPDYD